MPDPPGVPVPGGARVVPAVVLHPRLVGHPLDGLQGRIYKVSSLFLKSLCLVDAGQAKVSVVGVPVHQDALGPEAKEAGGGEGVQVCPGEEEDEDGIMEEEGGGRSWQTWKKTLFFFNTFKV